MRIDVLTLFPEMFAGVLSSSILKRAAESVRDPSTGEIRPPVASYHLHDIRAHSTDRHGRVDDASFGGGPGMVMACQPVWDAVCAAEAEHQAKPRRVLLTPQGRPLTQPIVEELSREPRLLLIAGHYEGIDERVIDRLRREGGLDEISLGDYVLSGGELPAMVLIDAVVRLLPGALGHEQSAHHDSFSPGAQRLLDHPHYTRPRVWEGVEAPAVLLSGNHAAIDAWRSAEAMKRTAVRRPDLLAHGRTGTAASAAVCCVTIRPERKDDHAPIDRLQRTAFPTPAEATVVKLLRDQGDAAISLVATLDDALVGHVVLGVATLAAEPSRRGLLTLGPIAVRPDLQRRGIGSALVREAVREARAARAAAVFLLGDPTFYGRLGFVPAAPLGYASAYGDGAEFMVHVLRETPGATGEVRWPQPFRDAGF